MCTTNCRNYNINWFQWKNCLHFMLPECWCKRCSTLWRHISHHRCRLELSQTNKLYYFRKESAVMTLILFHAITSRFYQNEELKTTWTKNRFEKMNPHLSSIFRPNIENDTTCKLRPNNPAHDFAWSLSSNAAAYFASYTNFIAFHIQRVYVIRILLWCYKTLY